MINTNYRELNVIYNDNVLKITYQRDLLDTMEQNKVSHKIDQYYYGDKQEQQQDQMYWICNEIANQSSFKIILGKGKKQKNDEKQNQQEIQDEEIQYLFYIQYCILCQKVEVTQGFLQNILIMFQEIFTQVVLLLQKSEKDCFQQKDSSDEQPLDMVKQFNQNLKPVLELAEQYIMQII